MKHDAMALVTNRRDKHFSSASKPKKLKLNKNFIALPRDDGDEFFPNGFFEFNITKLIAFIKSNPALFAIEEIDVKTYAIWDSKTLNEATVATADISNPIILAEIRPDQFNVIDGNHRLEKARRQAVPTISAYKVMADQHLAFLTSEKSYRSYVEYWNAKVAEWKE